MNIEEIEKKLVDQVALSVGQEPSEIKPDMLLHDMGLDSLGLVELFVFIEKEFEIKLMESDISQEEIMRIDSLAAGISRAAQKK